MRERRGLGVGRRRGRGGRGGRGEGRRWEVGDAPDRWAPPVGDRVRERERRGGGRWRAVGPEVERPAGFG
jgi:hypothetical protein